MFVERIEGRAGCSGHLARVAPGGFGERNLLVQPPGFIVGILHSVRSDGWHRRILGLLAQEGEPLSGERVQVAETLLHGLEPERGSASSVDGVADLRLLEATRTQPSLVELLLEHDSLGLALALATGPGGDRGAEGHNIVGEDAGAGIPHDRSDRLSFARDLGLMPERLQLPPDLASEIAEPREVDLHRVELAQGLLFAATVLQDSRGLLDEATTPLGARMQHRVELPLADDHMHFAAEAGVAQQFLHVEQATSTPIDRVLTTTAPKESASDRHLGVVDGQGAVGVVDGENDLGATERALGRRASEDDVVHLAAAEGFGTLLPHHPGEGVDHIRLARSVRTDHTGDARFEREGGRLREGLEPLEGQALQIHAGLSG